MNAPIPIKRGRKAAPLILDDEFTDRWAGREFARRWSLRLRYLPDRAHWRRWDGKRWAFARDVDLVAAAKETADDWLVDASIEDDPRRRRDLLDWARRACSIGKLNTMVELAKSEPIVWTPSEKFDINPALFNTASGTVDLSSGEAHAHDPADYITKLSPVPYDVDAKAPRFIRFIDEVFANNMELIGFVQRAAGYSMTGHTREHCFIVAHGQGGNGKGALMRALGLVAGDYGSTAQIETFTAKRPNAAQATPDLAALAGLRFLTAGEADAGVKLSEGLVKSLTGDDPITCRNLNEGLFTYRPQFTLWLHVNHRPSIRGVDAGIWRRVRLVPFDVSFEGRADKELDAKLAAEAPGILAWAVRGAREWFANGLGSADAVSSATADYRDECDVLAPFLEMKFETNPKGQVTRKRVVTLYQAWCEQNGEEPVKTTTFYRLLQDRAGVTPFKVDGERGFRGISERKQP